MTRLRDKVALVSGSSRGVGLALARALVGEGARVVLSARGEARLEEARAALSAEGGEVVAVAGDVAVRRDAEAMVSAALDPFGRLDVLVNNAGVSMRGRFAELSAEVCERVVATNLLGSIQLSRAAVEHVVTTRGHIVFVSSIAGLMGLPGASVYCAAKGALTGLAGSLRLELADAGVHVGVVYLGFTEHDPEKTILTADGAGVPPDRPAHQSQAEAAEGILRMLRRRDRELVTTQIGRLGWLAQRLSPALTEAAIRWAGRRGLGAYERFA